MVHASATMSKLGSMLISVHAMIGSLTLTLSVAALGSPNARAEAHTDARVFKKFATLRNHVLNIIGGASERIWLSTDFLSDGEIVSALYIAQYRKINVQVLLGKRKANRYMSRLNYLKSQKIPVFLKPDKFKFTAPSGILVDQDLIVIDGELDFLAKYKRFALRTASREESQVYQTSFKQAVSLKLPAVPRPIPLVGRAKSIEKKVTSDQAAVQKL